MTLGHRRGMREVYDLFYYAQMQKRVILEVQYMKLKSLLYCFLFTRDMPLILAISEPIQYLLCIWKF